MTFHIFEYIGHVIIPTVTHSIIFQRGRAKNPQAVEGQSSEAASLLIPWIMDSVKIQRMAQNVAVFSAVSVFIAWLNFFLKIKPIQIYFFLNF